MDSLEQAREALETARDYIADVVSGKLTLNDLANIKPMAVDDLTRVDKALVALSSPVEGEPVAWRARHSEQENWYLHESPVGWWECQPLYAAPPVADSEALRERVAEATAVIEELKFALFANSMPIKDRADQSARLFLEAAEARLAQAERGPAVTEDDLIAAMMAIEESDNHEAWFAKWRGNLAEWKNDHSGDCTKQPWTCLRCTYEEYQKRIPAFKTILAALHPQSAAGEEGK